MVWRITDTQELDLTDFQAKPPQVSIYETKAHQTFLNTQFTWEAKQGE